MVADLSDAHKATIALAADYIPKVLAETNQVAPAVGELNLQKFDSSFPDGGTYSDLLTAPIVKAKEAIVAGADWSTALRTQDALLTTLVLTALADSRREVYQTDLVSRPTITGFVRQLNPPSCARCVILAGKWFRWNEGFQRHPRCDCIHIPAAEQSAGDLTTDPYKYFQSLSESDQVKVFGKNNSQIIRDYGGDINRVVNVQMRGLSTPRNRWGTPRKRVNVDAVIDHGGDRDTVIKILKEQGYITGPKKAGGNLLGNGYERFSKPITRPVVPGSARDRVLQARATGVRDPLDRDTMTAAERRLFDANYRLEHAKRTGFVPPSITNPRGLRGSDADTHSSFRGLPATADEIARLESALHRELAALEARLKAGIRSDGILAVANALGLPIPKLQL